MAQNTPETTSGNTTLYSSGFFNPVTEQCEGCDRIIEIESSQYCRSYAIPAAKWKLGICNFATHIKPEIKTTLVKINPLKAAKRG